MILTRLDRCLPVFAILAVGALVPAQNRPAKGSSAERPAAQAFPASAPASVGVDAARLELLVAGIEQWIEAGDVVGVELLVIKDGRTILHEARGWFDREREMPMRRDSIFRIRSMTKPFVGTSILMLADAGALSLDDPVAKHLASWDNERSGAITIAQLLCHEGGFDQPGYPRDVTTFSSLRASVDAVGEAGPQNEPGQRYAYSDAGSATLGAIVAEVAGMPCEEFITSRILLPLGMADTMCNLSADDARRPRVASTYVARDDGFVRYWDHTQPQQMSFFRASGGMYSTPKDYARFLAAWMRGGIGPDDERLLADETARAAVTPSAKTAERFTAYGQQWQVFRTEPEEPFRSGDKRPLFGHGGSDGTFAIADPERGWIACYFTQSRNGRTIGRFARAIHDAMR